MTTTKEILKIEKQRLDNSYKLIDYWLDWLRLWTNEDLKIIKELEKYKFNTTTWNAVYNFRGFDLVLKTHWRQGVNYNFIRNYNFNGFSFPINLFAITKTNKKNNIGYSTMLNFYGVFFQLSRLNKLDVDDEINYLLQDKKARITRVDYNFNYSLPDKKSIEKYISRLGIKYADIGNKWQINNETFYIRYKQSGGRLDNWKKLNKETKRLWLKRYDKNKNIDDLDLNLIYSQYENLAILRFECLIGSQVWNENKDERENKELLEKKVISKILWSEKIITSQNQKKQIYITKSYISKNKKTTEAYLTRYLKQGWKLKDLIIDGFPLFDFADRKDEIDEALFTVKEYKQDKNEKEIELNDNDIKKILLEIKKTWN